MDILALGLVFFVGVFMGCVLISFIHRVEPAGTLIIDTSDPTDGPYLFVELSEEVSAIGKREEVTFEVETKGLIPHE